MKSLCASFVLAAGLIASTAALAQATAPAGSTGLCKDGSYTSHETKKGACAGHKGVKEWFGAAAAEKPTAPTAASKAAAATAAHKAAPATKTAAAPMGAAPAAGGGPGRVWVNTESKVYHCAGSKWYGKTKHGEYMSEAAAKAAGDHPDHGKACAS